MQQLVLVVKKIKDSRDRLAFGQIESPPGTSVQCTRAHASWMIVNAEKLSHTRTYELLKLRSEIQSL